MADNFDAGINRWSTARTSSTTPSSNFDTSSAIANVSNIQHLVSGPLIDSSSQISGFGMDYWNQSLLRTSSSTARAEPSFHTMLHESLNCPSIDPVARYQDHIANEQFLINNQQQQHQQGVFPMMPQGLFEPEAKPQHSIFETPSMSMIGNSYHERSQFPTSAPLQFSNNTAFWNASASIVSEARSGFNPSTMPTYHQKPTCSKSNLDIVTQKKSGSGGSSSTSEPALKKTRIEAPSPLPTFKVRKEKLGDRITALQQLVSPFGKTDTASVLHEAIEYIKFLHDQVCVLSTPYLKNGHPMQHQESSDKPTQDLRSRGLCLVPIESTYPVASETTTDFWGTPFGGSYR